ncbi:Chondroitin polymerase [Aerococcus viridans]|uniref:Glycosyltransferase n=2 Tax=Aerococcus viridans TaxID=1377 RepID=A0AAU8UNE2_9LACT|nr:glycosyltransferase [Aerococcus viridans]AMC01372.1 glycosyltransferase [Aerococcus viridans]EFG50319.1 glycosyltransferase, group 2 family protein [Aerococcus viridans ATCC 11563 = CCUG 4311]SUU15737.1 Chondroitin polymerase [Aerococcus viridans]
MVKISVIMGAFNCENTITEALDSLWNQTFQDFEVVICDDGSTDNTLEILKKIEKSNSHKVKLLFNEKNQGLNYTLNKCLKAAQGELIARMDADDISFPNRFETQLLFLQNHSDIDFVSSNMIFFDELGDWGQSDLKEYPEKADFVKSSPFAHAPVIIKKSAYNQVDGYTVDDKLLRVEDYHLWIKLYSSGYKGANIQVPLYKMRDDQEAFKRRSIKNRINEVRVKLFAVNQLELSKWNYVYSIRPLLVALLPYGLYNYLHKRKLNKR